MMKPEHDIERLRQELDELRIEHYRVLDSSSYKLGRLLTGALVSPRKLLRLPVDLYGLLSERRAQRRPPGPSSSIFQRVQSGWQGLADNARETNAPVVFLFSGTTHIQGTRGNRPIRQTQALLRLGVKVLFSYHRSRFDEPLPGYVQEGLVQSPADITLQLLSDVAASDLGNCKKLYIVSYPYPGIEQSVDLFRRHGWRVVYDCRDDWEEFAKVGMARWFDAEVERRLVASCDATLCVSGPLVEKMRRLAPGRQVMLVPNAVEVDFLPVGYHREPHRAPPVVGYFGHLSSAWFDWESFLEIARRSPQYRFEVIGHSAPQGLELTDNVALLGPKPWQQLHHYASRWSAAIIPFRMGPLADGVDPIKIYEYLSFGLPVVSFRMPQIEQYPYTTTVDSIDAFCLELDVACRSDPDPSRIAEFIAHNTWEVRAEQLIAMMEPVAG